MSANPNPNPNPNPLPGGEGVGSGELGRAEAKEATEPSDDWSWPTLMRRSHRALSTPRSVALPSASERSSGMGTEVAPGLPQYAVRTDRPRLVPSTYCTWGPGGKPPCASGPYPTREAGTRSPYVPNGGPAAYASAQGRAREGGEIESLRAELALLV